MAFQWIWYLPLNIVKGMMGMDIAGIFQIIKLALTVTFADDRKRKYTYTTKTYTKVSH